MQFTVERTSDEVLTIHHAGVVAGWEQRYLWMGCVHFDSPHCDRKLLTKHLNQAKEQSAGIGIVGDWHDAMAGKNDRRGTKETARKEDVKNAYFNSLVNHTVDFLSPYRENIVFIGDGNHDTAITKHNEIDLLELACNQLGVQHTGYSGFVRQRFEGNKNHRASLWIYYHHGAGGGGVVTKGVMRVNRQSANVRADIFIGAHYHESWLVENVVVEPTDSGRIRLLTQTHVQLPTYKQEYTMLGGYHIENARPPKPLGAYWQILYYDKAQPGNVGCRFERAN